MPDTKVGGTALPDIAVKKTIAAVVGDNRLNIQNAIDEANKNGAGYWESWGTNVLPRSLYIAQLKDRLGATAVDNVTSAGQRNGAIYEMLRTWAGEGKLNTQ